MAETDPEATTRAAADDELVLYTHPMSRGRIARWMLEELGRPYRAEIVDYGPVMKAEPYRSVNPMGKVPALRHGDTVVTECAAICAYLADAFPEAGLAPAPGSRARGPYYRWLFFAAGPIEQAVFNKMLGFEIGDDPRRRGQAGYGSLQDVLDTLEGAVDGKSYIVGDRFSAADVYVGAHVIWGIQFGTVEARPALERYAAGLRSRPAKIRTDEIDDALLKEHPLPSG